MTKRNHKIRIVWGVIALLAAGMIQADEYTTFNDAGSYTWNGAPWSAGLPNGISSGTNSSQKGLMKGNGTVTIDASSTGTTPLSLLVGWSGNANLNITGGTLTLGSDLLRGLSIGESGVGTVTQSGGTVTAGAVYFNRMTNSLVSKGTYTLNGGTLALGSFSRPATSVSTNVSALNLNGGTLKATASTTSWVTGAFNVNVQAGGAIIDTQAYNVTFATALLNGGGGLTKNGAGTLTLAGLNTYAGDTTVSAGELLLANSSQMSFVIGANGTNNRIDGSGTLTANGAFVFDLTGAGTTIGDSWTIVNTNSLTSSFGSTFSIAGFTDNGDNTWSKQSGSVTYIFYESTGVLSVTGGLGLYTTNGTPHSWLDQYGLTNYVADDVLDQDVDGLKTWQEYIAGTVPTDKDSVFKAAQAVRNVVTWTPVVTGRVYSVHWSANLVQGFTNKQDNIVHPQSSYTNTLPDDRVNHYQIKVRLQE